MRWLTTILLMALVAGSAFWIWKGDTLAPSLGLTAPQELPRVAVQEAAASLPTADVQAVSLTIGSDTLSLILGPNGEWTQPGNWPVRQDEANELVATLTSLQSRFAPVTPESGDLKPFGLHQSQNPISAKISGKNRTITMTIGRPEAQPDQPEYARPTYVKVDDHTDLLRFDSDLMQVVARKPEDYRRKQLFPEFERFKLSGGEPTGPNQTTPPGGRWPVVGNVITSIKIETANSGVLLNRVGPNPKPRIERESTSEPALTVNQLSKVWELDGIGVGLQNKTYTSLRDRVDPAKLRGILTAIPEIWVEQFLPAKPAAETGLDQPERVLTINRATGPTTLKIGRVSRTVVKPGPPPPPPQPFAPPPPPPQPTIETYHYASIDGLDLLFEIKANPFSSLFLKPDELRDPLLARFETNDVQKVELSLAGQKPVIMTRRKGNPKAEKTEDQQDRWYIGETLAESAKITELIDALAKLEAKNPETPADPLIVAQPMGDRAIIDNPDAKQLASMGLDGKNSITLTVQPQPPEGQPALPAETITFLLGKHDEEKKKWNIQVAGWPRANVVADDAKKLVDRPALAYRGRQLFDTAELKLSGIAITPSTGDAFALSKSGENWNLTKPLALAADEAKATQITGDLSRLEAIEYVDDAPKPEDLDQKYGLAKPALTIVLNFGAKTETIAIGKSPEFKPEYYARRNNSGSVFTISKPTIDSLNNGALALLPLQLWSVQPDQVASIEIQRAQGKESYKLVNQMPNWSIAMPFQAPVPFSIASAAASAVANIKAEKYEATKADPSTHGLDQPAMKVIVSYKESQGENGAPDVQKTRTLLVGKPAPAPNTRYAQLMGEPNSAIFTINDSLVNVLNKPALELLEKSILAQDADTLTKIQITGTKPEETVALIKDEQGNWKAEGAKFSVDRMIINQVAGALARPAVEKIVGYGNDVAWKNYGLDQPAYTITGTFNVNGKATNHTIKLGKTEGGARYARADNDPKVALLSVTGTDTLARGKLDFADRTLLTFDAPTLMSLTRKMGKNELEIVQGATVGWDMTKPAKHKADQSILDELSDQLSRLRAVKVAAFAPGDLKSFGLDQPAATISLKVGLDQPMEKILKIGKPVDDKKPDGDRYAMVDGQPQVTVGVLSGTLAKRLLAEPLKFRDRALARFLKADRVEMTRGNRTVTFAQINGTWKLVKPIEAEADQVELDEFINAMAKLRADELIAEKAKDLKAYGLDQPTVKWVLKSGDKEELSLLVGNTVNGRAYVKLDKGDLVGSLNAAATSKVTGEYRKRSVWSGVDASQVESITFQDGKTSYRWNKVGANWIDAERPTDRIATAKVSELLDALAGLKALRYAADSGADLKLYGLQPPQRTITITQQGGVTRTLAIGREEGGSNGKRLYSRVEDPARTDVFVLSEADTSLLTRSRSDYIQK